MTASNRLPSELQRLFVHEGSDGRVRSLLLQVERPAGWQELAGAWAGVQRDLSLPAPAIAVSGADGYQLWFSLAQPVEPGRALAFLQQLCRRYLPELAPERIRLQAGAPAATLPPLQLGPERWSAFIAPDLTTLFEEERWLDHPPGQDAQADLLSRVESVKAEAFRRAEEQLARDAASHGETATATAAGVEASSLDPRHFLQSVMQDAAAPLHLRVEAAKALLASEGRAGPR